MAVEKLASGRIFVGAPYKRTAAENYVSLFTKSRLEEFERAQKDARDEAELQKLSYKAQLAAYQERIKANERTRAKLEDLRVRVMNKQVDDETARQELALTLGEKEAARKDAMARAGVATGTYTEGGTTTTTGGGGGRRPPRADAIEDVELEQVQLSKAKFGADKPADFAADVRGKIDSGFLPGTDAVRYNTVAEAIDADAAAAIAANPTMPYEDARALAEQSVLGNLDANGAGDFSSSYERVKDAVDKEETGGGGTRTTVSTRKAKFYRKYPNLPGAAEAVAAEVPETPSRQAVLDAIAAAEGRIAAPELPTAPTFDPFTRGRSLYSQRFGPTVPIPAYAERNLTRTLLDLPPEMQAQIGASYREYLAQQETAAAPAPTPAPVVGAAPAAAPPEPVATPVAPAPEAAPTIPPPVAAAPATDAEIAKAERALEGKRLEVQGLKEAAAMAEPAEPRIAPTAPPAPPPAPVEDPETRALRQQAMAAVQAREVAAKKAELQALIGKRAADRATVDALLANVPSVTPMPVVPGMTPPPAPERRTLPQFTPPEQRAAPVNMPQVNTADARKRALELAALGMKPEGALMATPPAAPSTAMAAPKQAAKLDLKGPGPLAAKTPAQLEAETDAQVLAASEVSVLTKNLVEDEKFRERVLRTKPGEFAAKVYRANLDAKKSISATQNTVVDEYMGNTKDMKTALAVAYALDALNKPVSPVKALTK
jgi:hypothetical protein